MRLYFESLNTSLATTTNNSIGHVVCTTKKPRGYHFVSFVHRFGTPRKYFNLSNISLQKAMTRKLSELFKMFDAADDPA